MKKKIDCAYLLFSIMGILVIFLSRMELLLGTPNDLQQLLFCIAIGLGFVMVVVSAILMIIDFCGKGDK